MVSSHANIKDAETACGGVVEVYLGYLLFAFALLDVLGITFFYCVLAGCLWMS